MFILNGMRDFYFDSAEHHTELALFIHYFKY